MRFTLPFVDIQISLRPPRRGRFLAVLLGSSLLHFIVLSLIGGLLLAGALTVVAKPPPDQVVTISSALNISKRTVAVRTHGMSHPAPTVPQVKRNVPPPPLVKRELAAIAPTAPPLGNSTRERPERPSLTQSDLERDQRTFEQTSQQLKAENDPLAGTANANVKPEAPKPYHMNLNGTMGTPTPQGILEAIRMWREGDNDVYYVRYTVEYSDGSQESGTVPWPIHFPHDNDPLARGDHRLPLPGPPPTFVGDRSTMTPLVLDCYDHRYPYCLIEHE